MMEAESDIALDDATRAFILSSMPKLPDAITQLMLADAHVRKSLRLPAGDYIRLFERRFDRAALFRCLRDIANGRPASLVSSDGTFSIEKTEIDPDGSAAIYAEGGGARFANVGLMSEDAELRLRTLETSLDNAELAADREAQWRAAIELGPLDDDLFTAFETTMEQSPEAIYRRLYGEASEGISFDALVPNEPNLFAGLLGIIPVPGTLGEYRKSWIDILATLDSRRLARALLVSAPLSVLRGNLIADAAQRLDRDTRLSLARQLATCRDPFSALAAAQICIGDFRDTDFAALADELFPLLLNRKESWFLDGSNFLSSSVILATAVASRKRVLQGWPTYARRLAWFLHASHLVRIFGNGEIEPRDLARLAGQPMLPNARTAELCDAAEIPYNLAAPFSPAHIYSLVLARLTQALFSIPETERPTEWSKSLEGAIDIFRESDEAIIAMVPGPFDPFETDWAGLIELPPASFDESFAQMDELTESEKVISDLLHLVLAFEADEQSRDALSERLPKYLKILSDEKFIVAVEAGLQLAARWRRTDLSEELMDQAIKRSADGKMPDLTASARLSLLGAASQSDPVLWAKSVGEFASAFAYSLNPGPHTVSLLVAIDIIQDFAPQLEEPLAGARSYCVLANDRLT